MELIEFSVRGTELYAVLMKNGVQISIVFQLNDDDKEYFNEVVEYLKNRVSEHLASADGFVPNVTKPEPDQG